MFGRLSSYLSCTEEREQFSESEEKDVMMRSSVYTDCVSG